MPFTVNVGPYVGGQMIQQGLTNLGQGIAGGITGAVAEYKKTQQEQENDKVLLNFFQNQGMVTPEIMNDYQKGSHSAKTGVIAGLTRQFAAQQQLSEQKRLQQAQDTAAYNAASDAAMHAQQIIASKAAIPQAQKELESLDAYRKAEIAAKQAELNFQPQVLDVHAPPTGQTGIPFGPPTEAEAATPTVRMISQSPGRWTEPQSARVGRASDKVPLTIQGPEGPVTAMITGNKFYSITHDPVEFKKNYGVIPSVFTDPTQTKFGVIDSATGNFTQQSDGDYVQFGVHVDPKTAMQVVGGTIPREEWQRAKDIASGASQAIPRTMPAAGGSGAATPTPAPAAAQAKAGGPKPGTIYKGFRFKGGDPSKKENWEPVNG